MPYIYVETLEEGQEEVEVFTQDDINELNSKIQELENQRDAAIDRAVEAEKNYSETRKKYADTFLKSSKPSQHVNKPVNIPPQSLNDLFGNGVNNA